MDFKNILGLGKPDIKRMEREKNIRGLVRAMGYDNDEVIRKEAAFALGKITDPESSLYPKENENSKLPKLDESYGELSVEELIDSLKDKNWGVRINAAKALCEVGEPAVEPLINSLNNDNWLVRWLAAEILGEIGDSRAIEPLINTLKDDNNGVQSNSMIALVRIGVPALDILINSLENENWQVRWHAAEALGDIGNLRAIEPLVNRLTDDNGEVRMTATNSIGKIRRNNKI
jgi:bilin biosynthesis protein